MMSSPVIVCAGESLVDVITVDGAEHAVPGGGPMNAAVAAARLGAPTAFVGRVSTDSYGALIWKHLQDSGVDLRAAQRGPEPTARAVVTTAPVQSFRFEGDGTADASMLRAELSPLGPGPHLLHAGTLGIFRGTTAKALVDLLAGFSGLVSFDPNIRPQVFPSRDQWLQVAQPWLERADLIKASDEDLDWMGLGAADLFELGCRVLLRTLGGDGVEVFVADGPSFVVPARAVEVADTVGAGDSFCGAVLTGLLEASVLDAESLSSLSSDRWRDLVEFGIRAAAVTVSRLGADPPWRHELAS
jgi:fructokinase